MTRIKSKITSSPPQELQTEFDLLMEADRSVVSHIEHVEDYALTPGGIVDVMQAFRGVISALQNDESDSTVSIKIDGSPSVFAGTDPEDGKFFVAKKSIFNKRGPKVYKSPADVISDIAAGDLRNKMLLALKYMPALGISGIVQGDFLYSRRDLKSKVLDGHSYITFKPNTLLYAIPAKTKLALRILSSKIGVVWHTRYSGSKLSNIVAHADPNIAKSLHNTPLVWCADEWMIDFNGSKALSDSAINGVSTLLRSATAIKLPSTFLTSINEPAVNLKLRRSLNSFTRAGHSPDVNQIVKDVPELEQYKESVKKLLLIMQIIVKAKMIVLNAVNSNPVLPNVFVLGPSGYSKTNQEGLVVSRKNGSILSKFVDRPAFSFANFVQNAQR